MGQHVQNPDGTYSQQTILMGSKTIEVFLANAIAITDTAAKFYLVSASGLTSDEIRQYKEWKISISHSHNAAGDVRIYTANNAVGIAATSASGQLYLEAGALASGAFDLLYAAGAGGTGVHAQYKVLPGLKGIHSNILIRVAYPVAPTSGSLTIKMEGIK